MNVSALTVDGNDHLPNGTLFTPYSKTLRVLGGTGPYTISQIAGLTDELNPLPDGLSLNTSTFVVSGTPLENGGFNTFFQFGDSAGNSLQSQDFFNIYGAAGNFSPITVNQGYNLGTVTVGSFYNNNLNASFSSCCTTGVTWSLAGGALPPGLGLTSTGDLSGTPTTPGAYLFLIKVVDNGNSSNVGHREFTLVVTPINITTGGGLPYGDVGTSYGPVTLAATGGTGALTWTLPPYNGASQNVLPPGLTLSSTGVISGTPTESGWFFFNVVVTDAAGNFYLRRFNIIVLASGPPALDLVLGPNLGPFAIGNQTFQLNASGGVPPYTYSLTPSATPISGMRVVNAPLAPANFAIGNDGLINSGYIGVMPLAGTFSTSIRVTDSVGSTFDRAINIVISPLNITFAPGNFPKIDPGVAYSYNIGQYGTGGVTPYTWAASNLPPGITINSSTGVISGTTSSPGTYFPQITITDSTSTSLTLGYTVIVNAFQITTAAVLPDGTQGTSYSQAVSAPSCGGGCTFTITGGSLPNGLSLNSSTGAITGTPNSVQQNTFTIQAGGSAGTVQKVFSLQINSNTIQPLFITNGPIVCCLNGTGSGYTTGLFARGGTKPYTWSVFSGSLPPGIMLTTATGESLRQDLTPGVPFLFGKMLVSGPYSFTLQVKDAVGNTATQAFTMNVAPLSIAFNYNNLPVFFNNLPTPVLTPLVYNTAYSQQLLVMGGSGTYTFSLPSGQSLPPGLSISSTGLISGTPTNTGFWGNQVQVTDGTYTATLANINFNIACGTTACVSLNSGPNLGNRQQGFGAVINLNPSGGTGPYTITPLSSTLPPGCSIETGAELLSNANGSYDLTCQPMGTGTFTFTLQATDSMGNIGVRTYTINFVPFTLLSNQLANGSVGAPYSQQLITFDNGSTVTWSLQPGSSLPPGLVLSASGQISGTPTKAGVYSFSANATDGSSLVIGYFFTLQVSNLTITNLSSVPPSIYGMPYSFTLTASGGSGPLTWSAPNGLPCGLSLNSSTGAITGTACGLDNVRDVTITVTDGTVSFTTSFPLLVQSQNPTSYGTPLLTDTTVGVYTSYTLPAGTGTLYTWAVASGSTLPPGLSIIPASRVPANFNPGLALLAGIPSTAGQYTFDLIGTPASGPPIRYTFHLNVSAINILFGNPDNATIGVAYNQQFTAIGGKGPYTFAIAQTWTQSSAFQDTLPPGLSFNTSTGTISGTPGSTGNYSFTLTATDSPGNTFSRSYNLVVNNTLGLRVTSINPPDTPIGIGLNFGLSTNGTSTYSWSNVAGMLPPGVNLLASGQLLGIATAPGTYIFTLRATDTANSGNFADHVFTAVISPMQVVSPRDYNPGNNLLPPATVGAPYTFTFNVVGGSPPYTFTESPTVPLPPGLTLSSSGVLSGTPTVAGAFAVLPQITDSATPPNRLIDAAVSGLLIANPGVPTPLSSYGRTGGQLTFSKGVPMVSRSLELDRYPANTGTPPYTWSITSGSLPPGTSILPGSNGTSNYLSGIPTASGTFNFSYVVKDSSSQSYTGNAAINITPLTLTPNYLSNGIVGTPYSVTFTVSGGTAPYTFSVDPTQGMPPGLTLSSAGVLSGTPASVGFFPIGIQITDSASNSAIFSMTMAVDNLSGQVPAIALAPNPIHVTFTAGGTPPSSIPINVTSTSGALPFNISVAGIPGASLSVNGGTTPATVNLNFSAAGIAGGTYVGIVDAQSNASANWSDATPIVLTVVAPVPVTITSSVGGASVTITGTGCAAGSYPTPANVTWNPNTLCRVSFGDPLTIGSVTYAFQSATVNGTAGSSSSAIFVPSGTTPLTINAKY
ncbi:MAG: putative Ig domain-containing protein, partial [Bryobacterales bacterium]|nr:putative Ig domain-containing protein [Bryobacterales bacterium]